MSATTKPSVATSSLAASLRAAAEIFDAHPALAKPTSISCGYDYVEIVWHVWTADAMQTIRRTIGGTWEKSTLVDGAYYIVEQERPGVLFRVQAHREAVCERVVTGFETVTVPAVEAQPERVEQRDVVEWRCAPLLAEEVAR